MTNHRFNLKSRKWNILLVCLTLLLILLSFMTSLAQQIQPFQVKGKISFNENKVRASIFSKFNGRVQSDENGLFTMTISKLPDTLTISAVGYQTVYHALVTGNEGIYIELSTSEIKLKDVEISTGYQTVKPNEINGSIAVITSEQLNARGGSNILERLVGQSSGLLQNIKKSEGNVMNKTGLSVRGLGTFTGPLDPLIVLDGFIYEGNIANINPNDIDQVSILKDAAAASIWGARAGNGVIVLTTKRSGFNKKTEVVFSAGSIIKSLPDLFLLPQISSRDYIEVERLLFSKGYYDSRINNTPYLALSPVVELLSKQRRGLITTAQLEAGLAGYSDIDSRRSYLDEFYTHAITQQYSLGIRGGSENYSYMLSASYDNQLGETYAKSDKLNVNLSQEFKVSKRLTLSTKVYYTDMHTILGRPTYNSITVDSKALPYLSFRNPDGTPSHVATTYRSEYTDTAAYGKLLDWKYSPADEYKRFESRAVTRELYLSGALNYKVITGLNVNFGYQYQFQTNNSETDADGNSYTARNLINTFSQINRSTRIIRYIVPVGGILNRTATTTASYTLRAQANFDRTFGVHHINAILGSEIRENSSLLNRNTFYGYSADPMTFTDVDPITLYRTFLTGGQQAIGSGNSISSTAYRFRSHYMNLSYSLLDRYTLSASVRQDGSNIFGASTNDRWKPLWSAGLGWLVSNESFYHISWLSNLRLKATFGYSGNVDVTKTPLAVAAYSSSAVTGFPVTVLAAINNPGLRWEQLGQLSLGADFAFKDGSLSGAVSYFKKRGTDLYGPSPFDYTAWGGAKTLTKNIADMVGHGIEADLHSRNLTLSAFQWNTDLYFNYNQSRTVNYYSATATGLSSLLGGGTSITPLIGKPLYAVAGYKWAGLDAAGNPKGYLNGKESVDYVAMTREGTTTGDNMVYKGSAIPVVYGSLINTFRWRALSLSLNISYKLGYYAKKPNLSSSAILSPGIGGGDYASRWQKPGDELITDIPAFLYPFNTSRDAFYNGAEIHIINADNIRLDYINLAYKFNLKLGNTNFRAVEVYSGIQNLGIVWKATKYKIDPDYLNTLPPSKNILFGVRGSF